MVILDKDLKPFQLRAAAELATLIAEYPSERFRRYDPNTGELLPFLCRLQAITGAGKTPILCKVAQIIGRGIILWTTNRGAIVSQTLTNLQAYGKYGELLPKGTSVRLINSLSAADWEELVEQTDGLTILLSTVASFNRDDDKLKLHQRLPDGSTPWEMLGRTNKRRPLYIFYDEGHGATEKQFIKLRELSPKAFLLASASPLPEDLQDLLSGRGHDERVQSLRDRTVVVPTQEVVEAGLLKRRLVFVDCSTTQMDAVQEAQVQWQMLNGLLAPQGEVPIACFIVNETMRGVDVWENLVELNVPKSRIAVHLNQASAVMVDRHGTLDGLRDTYTGKRADAKSPEHLKMEGYTHIIWNMTLREGWDEPLAYVAYIDDRGKSETDIVQKVGRFVRQPHAKPYDHPDLNAAYYFFKNADTRFLRILEETQNQMEMEGYEVIRVERGVRVPSSRLSPVIRPQEVPALSPTFGDSLEALHEIALKHISRWHEDSLKATGKIRRRVLDVVRMEEDTTQRLEEIRESNDTITPWQYLKAKLPSIDSRLQDIFGADLQMHPKMTQAMQYGSEAIQEVERSLDAIVEDLNGKLRLINEGKYGVYRVKDFKLVSPDLQSVSTLQEEKYKVRRFANAVHAEYNAMNPFEVDVAHALDGLGLPWCRNPAGGDVGYKIPVPYLGAKPEKFYPDFLLWTDNIIWAIDPKGRHLFADAVQTKLLSLMPTKAGGPSVQVALVLQGEHIRTHDGALRKTSNNSGFTLIRQIMGQIKASRYERLEALVQAFIE